MVSKKSTVRGRSAVRLIRSRLWTRRRVASVQAHKKYRKYYLLPHLWIQEHEESLEEN